MAALPIQVRLDRTNVRNFINYGILTPAGVISIMNRTSVSKDIDPVIKNVNRTVVTKDNYVAGIASTITSNNSLITIPALNQTVINAITAFVTTAINNIVPGKRNTIKVALVIEKIDNSYTASLLLTTVNGDIKSVTNITVLPSTPVVV